MQDKHTYTEAERLFSLLSRVRNADGDCPYSMDDCTAFAGRVLRIRELKREKNAVVLAHVYVRPEIIFGAGDFAGDSYFLSKKAVETEADTIVFAGVRFMAETAKILNPAKQVLLSATDGGCTLADCIKSEELTALRKAHPEHTFVCYINTPAVVKAQCDVCVTSANAADIIAAIENDRIFFLTDRLMAGNIRNSFARRGIKKEVLNFSGCCYVHEKFTPAMVETARRTYPDACLMCHPECSQDVVDICDFAGSTSQIEKELKASNRHRFFVMSATGIVRKLQAEHPDKEFVGPSFECEYMYSNTLEDIIRVLETPTEKDIVTLDGDIIARARKCIDKMFEYAEKTAK